MDFKQRIQSLGNCLLHRPAQFRFVGFRWLSAHRINHEQTRATLVGQSDRGGLDDSRNGLQHTLDLGGTDLNTAQIHRVIHTSLHLPIALGDAPQLIAMSPERFAAGVRRSVSEVDLVVIGIEQGE